ncbi:MAG: hypothetical protein JXR63_12110 [Spirochaetales bacterium]|nr:hypothetical protein [Spirochaetales bacterium]
MKKLCIILLVSSILFGCQNFQSNEDIELLMAGIGAVTNEATDGASRAIDFSDETNREINGNINNKISFSGTFQSKTDIGNGASITIESDVTFDFNNYETTFSHNGESYTFKLNGKFRVQTKTFFGTSIGASNSIKLRNRGILAYQLKKAGEEEFTYSTPLSIRVDSEVSASISNVFSFSNNFEGSVNGKSFSADDNLDISISVPYHQN